MRTSARNEVFLIAKPISCATSCTLAPYFRLNAPWTRVLLPAVTLLLSDEFPLFFELLLPFSEGLLPGRLVVLPVSPVDPFCSLEFSKSLIQAASTLSFLARRPPGGAAPGAGLSDLSLGPLLSSACSEEEVFETFSSSKIFVNVRSFSGKSKISLRRPVIKSRRKRYGFADSRKESFSRGIALFVFYEFIVLFII